MLLSGAKDLRQDLADPEKIDMERALRMINAMHRVPLDQKLWAVAGVWLFRGTVHEIKEDMTGARRAGETGEKILPYPRSSVSPI